jgi:hypothetical protein
MDGRGLETKYYNEAGKCEYKMSVANAWTRLKMSEQSERILLDKVRL